MYANARRPVIGSTLLERTMNTFSELQGNNV